MTKKLSEFPSVRISVIQYSYIHCISFLTFRIFMFQFEQNVFKKEKEGRHIGSFKLSAPSSHGFRQFVEQICRPSETVGFPCCRYSCKFIASSAQSFHWPINNYTDRRYRWTGKTSFVDLFEFVEKGEGYQTTIISINICHYLWN